MGATRQNTPQPGPGPTTAGCVPRAPRILLFSGLALVATVATCVRIAPLIEGGDRIRRQCVSEDGYLMLTIARNLALGSGLSVSNGMIATNGTQPLATGAYALGFLICEGDKLLGLYGAIAFQFVTAVLATILILYMTVKTLYRGPYSGTIALIAATAWYAGPTSLMHTQNSLETGLYTLLVLISIARYYRKFNDRATSTAMGACIQVGLLLGVTFLARNDACFLIAALLTIHCVRGHTLGNLRRALAQAFVIGSVSLIVASPWLWFNVSGFGHLVPTSGRAEAMNASFGENALPACGALLENLLIVVRIPNSLQERPAFLVATAVVLAALIGWAWRKRQWLCRHFTVGLVLLLGFALCLCVYYALFFGMPEFLGRYLFIVSVPACLVASAGAVHLWYATRHRWHRRLLGITAAMCGVVCVGSNYRIYANGMKHGHFQVVDWVAANVNDETWVAAIQTGTLGYYHDRTINLDGKVDPLALSAREQGRIHEYVIERDVEYIVDWARIAEWTERPEFAVNYELVVNDPARNLAALRRKPQLGLHNTSAGMAQRQK